MADQLGKDDIWRGWGPLRFAARLVQMDHVKFNQLPVGFDAGEVGEEMHKGVTPKI